MGGNIFGDLSRRYSKQEYHDLVRVLTDKLKDLARFEIIPTYRQKESFGDMDILMDNRYRQEVRAWFQKIQCPLHVNGNVDSVLYVDFQLDLIFTHPTEIDMALAYFSWGDLGNLMGRVFHKTGFKYGHKGLLFLVKSGHYQFAEIPVSTDMRKILEFVEYDYDRWLKGFDAQEEIFEYVASSPYFNKKIYLLDNRSHTSRIRDRKRKMYHEFLEWIESRTLPEYPWLSLEERGGYVENSEWTQRAFMMFPGFEDKYHQTKMEFEQQLTFKSKFNGEIVKDVTGLTGKELGMFMVKLAQSCDLKEFVLKSTETQIRNWIYQSYCCNF